MKKKIAVIIVGALFLAQIPSLGVRASKGSIPSDPGYTTTDGTDGREVIPFYGYIGKDTNIVDPDPEEPEVKPETEIYVEVPVKVMFAAFESDAGAVTSPEYAITNLSSVNPVKVTVENFRQMNEEDEKLAQGLTLDITDGKGVELVPDLFPGDYSSEKVFKDVLPKKEEGSGSNTLNFAIGGNWRGEFGEKIHPAFEMTLKFTVIPV